MVSSLGIDGLLTGEKYFSWPEKPVCFLKYLFTDDLNMSNVMVLNFGGGGWGGS